MATIHLLGHWLLYAGYPFDRSFSSPNEKHTGESEEELLAKPIWAK